MSSEETSHTDNAQRSVRRRAERFRQDLPAPAAVVEKSGGWLRFVHRTAWWMIDGFRRNQANDLAAAVAYYALLAIVPTILALVAAIGLIMRTEEGHRQAINVVLWIVPQGIAGDGVEVLPRLREQSGALGLASLVGFLWIGSTFFAALGRAMNRVYQVPDRSPLHQRVRGFLGIVSFSMFFTVSVIAAIVPTAMLGIQEQDLPLGLERWAIFTGLYRIVSYIVALLVAIGLFGVIFRVVPSAGQTIEDVVPGAVISAVVFVLLAQVFPVYLNIVSGWNLIGGTAGLLSLVLIWFFVLSHLFLFGAYINATWQRWRRGQSSSLSSSPAETLDDRGQPGDS